MVLCVGRYAAAIGFLLYLVCGTISAQTVAPQNSGVFDIAQLTEKNCNPSENEGLILVSTLDGHVSAIDGDIGSSRLLWTVGTGAPLLSSTMDSLFVNDGSDQAKPTVIPSLDGNLYLYNNGYIQGLPLSAESLLSNSIQFGIDVVAGGKDIRTFGVAARSGKVLYECSLDGCKQYAQPADDTTIVIKRVTQTVRAADGRTGIERWNVTVSQHILTVSKRGDDGASCEQKFPMKSRDFNVQIVPPDGKLFAVDGRDPSKVLWEHYLDAPIAHVWRLSNGQLSEISLFNSNNIPGLHGDQQHDQLASKQSVLYVGTYKDEKYVIPPDMARDVSWPINRANPAEVFLLGSASTELPTAMPLNPDVQLTADGTCFNNCPTCSSDEVNKLISRNQYPRDMGWYLYKHTLVNNAPLLDMQQTQNVKLLGNTQKRYDGVDTSWHSTLIAFFAVAGAILVAVLIVLLKIYFNTRREPVAELSAQSSTATLTGRVNMRTQASLTESETDATLSSSGQDFKSRYLQDFQPIRCLGRGGFGVVYEARNLVDHGAYAVKRITLIDRPAAKDKVLREVHTLAQLDHVNIVRYYQSWFENPPPGWQDRKDREIMDACGDGPVSVADQVLTPVSVCCQQAPVRPLTHNVLSGDGDGFSFAANSLGSDSMSTSASMADSLPSKEIGLPTTTTTTTDFNELHLRMPNFCLPSTSHDGLVKPSYANSGSMEIVFESDNVTDRKSVDVPSPLPAPTLDKEMQVTPAKRMYLYISMQLCTERTLRHWLADNKARERMHMLDWFAQIMSAVDYVHSKGMIHRDLKPSNIFFSHTGQIKVGDFGLAKAVVADWDDQQEAAIAGLLELDHKHTNCVGTQLYMSPEQAEGRPYTHKVDLFSLGIILFEMLTPFGTEMERTRALQDVRSSKFCGDFVDPKSMERDVIKKLLAHDPLERPECAELLNLPLFSEFSASNHRLLRNRSSDSQTMLSPV